MVVQPDVTIYTGMLCPYCHRAKKLLEEQGIAFHEIDTTGKSDARKEMIRRSGGANTVPQVFVGDIHVGGSDKLAQAANSGELNRLLGRA